MPRMTCPSEQQLYAFELGELPESALVEVAEHLESCSQCESLAQRLDGRVDPILAALRSASVAKDSTIVVPASSTPVPAVGCCPGPHVLENFALGRIPGADAQNVHAHVEICKDCQAFLRSIAGNTPSPADGNTRADLSDTSVYAFLPPPVQPDEVGRLGNYRVLRLLGKGGMGYVFHAEDLALKRPVALKVMKPDLAGCSEAWQRFLREARIMAAIKHEHLITVFQAGEESGVVYLAMELLQGESLDQWIKRERHPPLAAIFRLAREITSGLAGIHGHSLLHRDIKPANIWLESPGEKVKILDFGLARFIKDDANLTQSGRVVGTPAYMSPEQARGEPVDVRSDIFSLGGVLYCLCTGEQPFKAANTMGVLTALAVETPKPVSQVHPAVPQALSDLIMDMLQKKPEDRPPSAEAVLQRLQEIEEGGTPGSPPRAVPKPTGSHVRSLAAWGRFALAAAVGAILVLAVMKFTSGPGKPAGNANVAVPNTTEKPKGLPYLPRADAPWVLPAPPGSAYLSEMKTEATENWPWFPPKGPREEMAEVRVKKSLSPHGIFMHPPAPPDEGKPASATYKLGKQYAAFHALVTLRDGPPESHTPLIFSVYGDGRLLWKSAEVTTQADMHECKISVKDVDLLKIEVRCGDDVRGAHGVWIEPYVAK